jgi:hypothetical protein
VDVSLAVKDVVTTLEKAGKRKYEQSSKEDK